MSSHRENISKFVEGLIQKEDVQKLYQTYEDDLHSITPQEVFELLSNRLKIGARPAEILPFVDKLINVFYVALSGYSWKKPEEGTFLFYLMKENDALIGILEAFKNVIKSGNLNEEKPALKTLLKQSEAYNSHLQKLENILFPYMEKASDNFSGLTILWTLHDETRKIIKEMRSNVDLEQMDEKLLRIQLGQLYFKLYGLVQKQTLLLFPAAVNILSENDFKAMHLQSFDYDFPYIIAPEKPNESLSDLLYEPGGIAEREFRDEMMIKTDTGILTLSQMIHVLNHLPVDITFVDADDKVVFFSKPKHRIFPRSAAVIGRNVRNCHPSESVDKVEAIIQSFKVGERDTESFWIQMKGMFILIQYFAVRDDMGNYLGTLEVSQEISQIQKLKGEKRLMSLDK